MNTVTRRPQTPLLDAHRCLLARYRCRGSLVLSRSPLRFFHRSNVAKPFLVVLVGIYLANNPVAQMVILKNASRGLNVDASFFLNVLEIQSWIALAVTAWVAPRLIGFDLADNVLPIPLSHPLFTGTLRLCPGHHRRPCSPRSPRLHGFLACCSFSIRATPLHSRGRSRISPSPSESSLSCHLDRIPIHPRPGSFLRVKWRVVLPALSLRSLCAVKWERSSFNVLRTKWGFLLNIPFMMTTLWGRLLGVSVLVHPDRSLPTSAIATMLILASLLCIAMLNARIRAREVPRMTFTATCISVTRQRYSSQRCLAPTTGSSSKTSPSSTAKSSASTASRSRSRQESPLL